jgi:hypothetical protein
MPRLAYQVQDDLAVRVRLERMLAPEGLAQLLVVVDLPIHGEDDGAIRVR